MAQYVYTHEPGRQDRAAQAGDPQGHLAVLLSRRQDRRAGPRTAPANRACCASWRASTRSTKARRCRCRTCASASCRRSRSSNPTRPCARPSRKAWATCFERKQKLEAIYAAYAEPDADFDKLAAEQAKYEAIIAAAGADTDVQMEIAADALRLPPWDAKIGKLSGGEKRRVALCRLLLSKPDMLLLDEPTNHLDAESVDWLEQFLQQFPGHGDGGHARPLLPRQRGRMDPRARSRLRHSVEGQLQLVARAEGSSASQTEAKQEAARIKAMQQGARMGAHQPQGPAGEEQGAHRALRGARPSYEHQKRNETQEIFIPVAERLGDQVIEFKDVSKGYGDRLLIDDLSLQRPARRDRRRHRAQRRRQVDACSG